MIFSLQSGRQRPIRGVAFYLLALVVKCMLVEIAYAQVQEFFMSDNDTASGPVIGVDLGMGYSRAGIMKNETVEIIVDNKGNRAIPSWVAFTDEEILIGEAAKNQVSSRPLHTIFDVKRLIGQIFKDKFVQKDIKCFPFKVINEGGQPCISVGIQEQETTFTSEEISAMILGTIKKTAEEYLGEPVKDAVIAVPAYFNDAQHAATKNAGIIAGLNILRIVREPIAAALAYGLHKTDTYESNALIYDLGNTLDVSIVNIEDGLLDVRSTAGDTHLGGKSFNSRMVRYLTRKYNKENNVDISEDVKSMTRLNLEVEKAKHDLSVLNSTKIKIDSFYKGGSFSDTVTRAQFEALNNDLFKKTLKSVNKALRDAKMKKSDIDDIILAGGSTRIPRIQQMLEEYFGKKALNGLHPEEVVVVGASIQGGFFANDGDDDSTCDCSCMFGISPLSLGIENSDGSTSRLIKRGTFIPNKKSQTFSTTADNQLKFVVKVVQGERLMAKDNQKLAEFELTNIAPAPRGIPQIEVTFELDVNNTLKVSAIDKDSGKSESISIMNHDQISEEDVVRMIEEAEKFADEDVANLERLETRKKLENYIYNLKNQINDNEISGKFERDDMQYLHDTIKEAEDWVNENAAKAHMEDFEEKLKKLSKTSNFISSKVSCLDRWCWWRWWYW